MSTQPVRQQPISTDVGEEEGGQANLTTLAQSQCAYFGASAVALNRLAGYYGYVPVAVDEKGVNIFYVHNSTVGGVPVFTWEEVVANVDAGIQAKAKCPQGQGNSSFGGGGSYYLWSDLSIWNLQPKQYFTLWCCGCLQEQGDSSTGGAGSYDSWSDPSIWNPLLLNTTWSALHGNCHDSVWLEVRDGWVSVAAMTLCGWRCVMVGSVWLP
eukprot:1137006-Pelagomonas_calceolata.AAC.1